jgi:hypothetical protein
MDFKPKNFRKISGESRPSFKIRTADGMPLILVKQSGEAMYANGRTDKDWLLAQFDTEQDLLLWGWVGQWRTDIFQLTASDVKSHYK